MSRPPVRKPQGSQQPDHVFPRWLTTTVVLVVLAMWVASVAYSVRNPEWPVPPTIHGVVILVVGAVLGVGVVRK